MSTWLSEVYLLYLSKEIIVLKIFYGLVYWDSSSAKNVGNFVAIFFRVRKSRNLSWPRNVTTSEFQRKWNFKLDASKLFVVLNPKKF